MQTDTYPADWELRPLRELVSTFLNGGTPSTTKPQYWDGNIPWITGADAENKITIAARKSVTERGVRESSTNVVPKGDILLVTRTGVGKVSIAGVDVAISQDLTGLILDRELINNHYLYWQLLRFGPYLRRFAQGTIIQGIEREEVEQLEIPRPLVPEQERIAAILDAVDGAIQQTDSLIAKLKQMREGLVHDLLTRGIDENGKLRDPSAHPEQFEDSELGIIPASWKVMRLGEIRESAVDGPFGSNLKTKHYVSEPGVRVVRLQNIQSGFFDDTDKSYVSDVFDKLKEHHKSVTR